MRPDTLSLPICVPPCLCLSFPSQSCWPLYLTPLSVSVSSLWRGTERCARWDEGGTPAQSHLGRNRAQRHQKPLLSYTWGAPAMGGGYAALHANRCQEPSQKHLRLINMKGAWTLLCKHVLKTDFVSACCIFRVCPMRLGAQRWHSLTFHALHVS